MVKATENPITRSVKTATAGVAKVAVTKIADPEDPTGLNNRKIKIRIKKIKA
jgi:hypothetical protein